MIGRTVLLTWRIRRFLRKHSPARCLLAVEDITDRQTGEEYDVR